MAETPEVAAVPSFVERVAAASTKLGPTKALVTAVERCSAGTIRARVAATCGVNTAAPITESGRSHISIS